MVPRRHFLSWVCRLTGGCFAWSVSHEVVHLTRINTTLFTEARAAEPCSEDTCATQDNCGATDTEGHVCQVRDVCDVDASDDCTNDECVNDFSGECATDKCSTDKSGACANDECTTDSSLGCTSDTCKGDSSGECIRDVCVSDKSGGCKTDKCTSDSSGACKGDTCAGDSSGACRAGDICTLDKSASCMGDTCESDKSGSCKGDTCESDKSGACVTDECRSDKSQGCGSDKCTNDASGECSSDTCRGDKSGACFQGDTCTTDASGACESGDTCASDLSAGCVDDEGGMDASGNCTADRCGSDYSGACSQTDVCVLDVSNTCDSDLCREDRSPEACGTSDTCALDLALDLEATRREFARTGINKAIKWLYKLSAIAFFLMLSQGVSHARTAIDGTNAVFYPTPTFKTEPVSVPSPVGPFLRDCDADGILEADTNGDGLCANDPEVRDHDGDGDRELPPGTVFEGSLQFTVFHVPDDVVLVSTGPLNIKASVDVRVFGVIHAASGAEIAAVGVIDLRTSAWMSEAEGGALTFTSALEGIVDRSMSVFPREAPVPTMPAIADMDNDGIGDIEEGEEDGEDADGDGIPDFQDGDTARLMPSGGASVMIVDLPEGPGQLLDLVKVKAIPDTDPSLDQGTKPAGRSFPYGLTQMTIVGLSTGQRVGVTLHFPGNIPRNAEYWAYDSKRGWYTLRVLSHDGDETIKVFFKDDGPGDADGKANKTVTGPSGVAIPQ